MSKRWDHHPPCTCGCGELADECAGPNPSPFGSMTLTCWCGLNMTPRGAGQVGCPQHFDNARSVNLRASLRRGGGGTPHSCTILQEPGACFRCDLNRDEMEDHDAED